MANVTLSIPKELKDKMDKFPDTKWSEIIRRILIQKVKQLKKFKELSEGGKL